ncbi:hypothetical protein DVA67_030010 [Solirubrobacter sp. CPCC 204708]|uniref:Fibronectin type-III domain-containing protein n=1 Tax=Solirubrobacter deserti TaxID=2282478 RepID=A0ABT4RII2_9ACTN|nr:hypothetical protein [Solirubrobacter deserti]MBE2320240.1 hypothetical protein [Solirubrobacter deserti]MDA0138374.1 hypothetical protein [Solirubrobacter deserti]
MRGWMCLHGSTPARLGGWLVALVAASALFAASAQAAPSAPDALPQTWGVQVDAALARALDRPVLRQLRAVGMTLVAAPGLDAATGRRLTSLAQREKLPLIQPLGGGAEACVQHKLAEPGHRCAVAAASPAAARALAAGGDADLVVVSASTGSGLNAGASRVMAVVPLRGSGYRAATWRREINAARSADGLDLAVLPTGSGAQAALIRYLKQLRPLARGDRSAPTRPATPLVVPSGGGGLAVSWSAVKDAVAYAVYLDGRRTSTVASPGVQLPSLACTPHLVEVDAVDKAGNRSAKAFATATPSGCGIAAPPSPISILPGPPAPGMPTPTPTATAAPTPETTITSGPSGPTNRADASFTFTATVPGATFECRLDTPAGAGTFSPCTSPRSYATNVDGDYTFVVRAVDAAGNPDPTPATRTFTVQTTPSDTQPPTTPGQLGYGTRSQTSVQIEWEASTDSVGVAGYRVFRDSTLVGTTQALTFTYSLLTCGTSYSLGVEALDGAGNVSQRATIVVGTDDCPDTSPPTAPARLRALSVGETSIRLAWEPSIDDIGVTGYYVYRGGSLVDATTGTEIEMSNLQCGAPVEVGIVARDAAENLSQRNTVTVSTAECSDKTPPSSPAGLKLIEATPELVSIAWDPSTDDVGVTGYRVYIDGRLTDTVDGTSAILPVPACDTAYQVAVEARDAAGNGSVKATLAVRSAICPDTSPPTPPRSLRATASTETTVTLVWDAGTDDRGVAEYRLHRNGVRVTSTSGTSATVTGLKCGTTYEVGVVSADAAGNTSASTVVSASTSNCTSPEPEPATLFVSPTGSDQNECTRAAPCAGFDRAFRISKPGDVVEVASGRYGSQIIKQAPGHENGPDILFRPAKGARVVLDELAFGSDETGPDHIAVRGMEMSVKATEPGVGNQVGIYVGPGSTFITLDDMDAGSVHAWLVDHLTVRGGDYGPCHVVAPITQTCGNSKLDLATNVTIDGATFHDYRFDETCFEAGFECHWECMYINAGHNISIVNSKFRQCAIFDIFATISGPQAGEMGHRDLTIENNWLAAPWAETPTGGTPTRASAVALSWCQNGPEVAFDGVRVAFNSFAADTTLELDTNPECTWKDVDVVGNLMMWDGCHPGDGWTYAYNVWSDSRRRGTCAATDSTIGSDAFPYADASTDDELDFHLDQQSVADDHVPAVAGCPAKDIDGQPRPAAGSRCDAGADER